MQRFRILLAEDSPAVARELRLLLARDCDVVGLVEDGVALVRRAIELGPDLVVTDISMPVMDGIEAAERLQRCIPPVPVVFITVHDEIQLVQRALRLACCGYVLKADAGEDLLAAVASVMEGRRFVSQSIARRWPKASLH